MPPDGLRLPGVAELPPYTAILVVDVMDFSGRRGRDHAALTESIPGILRQTFTRCGLGEFWDEQRFGFCTGDGYVLGLRSALLPFLLNPFLPALQEELSYRNTVSPASGQGKDLRMRVTVHVGPVTRDGKELISEGSGTPRVEAHRLIDAQPVKDLLARSSPVTCVAAIVSARAYADAVLSGYADDDPTLYVPAPVEVKSFEGTAYLRVPRPSGDLLTSGFRLAEPVADSPASPDTDSGRANSVRDVHGTAVQAHNYTDSRQGGIGNVTGTGNTTFSGTHGPVNTGTGPQYNAPHFSGERVNYVAGDNSGVVESSGPVPPPNRDTGR